MLVLDEVITAPSAARLSGLGLTPREAEILAVLARGKTTQQIAATLSLSEKTVRTHLERVYTKLASRYLGVVGNTGLEPVTSSV